MGYGYDGGWSPYVPVHERRRRAVLAMEMRRKAGHAVSPVRVTGRDIATTWWGRAWCTNLERYSDFSNRLPRGRTYVRNGSVVDLQVSTGSIRATVSGSDLYDVTVAVKPVAAARWKSICADCAGSVASLVELLQGRLQAGVMERITKDGTGLFPTPKEIDFDCSCPDYADMCKHIAAVLYGIGARLDQEPQVLFGLRGVDEKELIAQAGRGVPKTAGPGAPSKKRLSVKAPLSEVFGIEIAEEAPAKSRKPAKPKKKPTKKRR